MRADEWRDLSEQDFDSTLENSMPELPPGDIVAEVTPWKKAMNRVLTGMALFTLTLNFWGLNYVLPAAGVILTLLGFRTLRRENEWFRGCFVLTAARAVYFFPALILNTTILQDAVNASMFTSVLGIVNSGLTFVLLFCLRQGLRAVQQKAGLTPHTAGATALLVWYMLICLLAVIQYSGLIIGGAMIIVCIFLLRSLFRLSRELDEAGYAVKTAPVRLSERTLVLGILALLFVGCACGYLFSGSYHMDWRQAAGGEHAGVEEIEAGLVELGFPKAVLEDLSPEDISACEGALQVVAEVRDHPVNDGRAVSKAYGSGVETSTVYDVKELQITGVAVELPGEREQWKIFHHFLWTRDPGFYGTESIQLWPAYRLEEGWSSAGELSGRVLCDGDGVVYTAPYAWLGSKTVTSGHILWGEQTSTDVYAAFSMPRGAERCRGYLSYTIEELRDGYIVDAWINYTHQRSWMQYPVMTAMEKRMANGWNDGGAFLTIQDALQFYPTGDGAELIG